MKERRNIERDGSAYKALLRLVFISSRARPVECARKSPVKRTATRPLREEQSSVTLGRGGGGAGRRGEKEKEQREKCKNVFHYTPGWCKEYRDWFSLFRQSFFLHSTLVARRSKKHTHTHTHTYIYVYECVSRAPSPPCISFPPFPLLLLLVFFGLSRCLTRYFQAEGWKKAGRK